MVRKFWYHSPPFWIVVAAVLHTLFLLVFDSGYTWEQWVYHPVAMYLAFFVSKNCLILVIKRFETEAFPRYVGTTVLSLVVFLILQFVLQNGVVLLLERLFQLPEHYSLPQLILYMKDNWHTMLEALPLALVWVLGNIVLHQMKDNEKLSSDLVYSRSALKKEQLQHLSIEMNPHFLFNAMNGIVMKIRSGAKEEAADMLASLSQMLRNTLSERGKQLVPIQKEIQLLESYLFIEKNRFKDKVKIEVEVDPEVLHYKLPFITLQPLVENAFKHGVANSIEHCSILISIKKEKDRIRFKVFNSSEDPITEWNMEEHDGIGLSNTVNRLKQIFEDQLTFKIKSMDQGFAVEFTIPAVR